jgi:hypothetical protein
MKSKLFKVIGVVATIAILASVLVAVPAMAITQPTVTMAAQGAGTAGVISNTNKYTITFTAGAALTATVDKIVVAFPATTNITGFVAGDATFEVLTGIGGGPIGAGTPATAVAVTGTYPAAQTLTITVPAGGIGSGSLVGLTIGTVTGITNPTTAGTYTLTVGTTTGAGVVVEAAVTSASYTIVNPTPVAVAGVASVYNTAGILMSQSNSFTTALAGVTAGGTIKLSAGTYNTAFVGNAISCTIQGTGTASDVILKSTGAWNMTGATVVFDGVTIDNTTAALTMTASTAGTIKNSALKGGVTTLAGLLDTVDTCTVTVLTGAVGIAAGGTAPTIKNSTFSIAGTGVGIGATVATTITADTFTGAVAGQGVVLTTGGTSAITGSTFTTLTDAVQITTPACATFIGNTVDACGVAATTPTFIINSVGAAGFAASNNKITNSKYYVATVTLNDALVSFIYNDLSGSVKGFNNVAAVMNLLCTNNYWGTVDPAATGINTAKVNYANKQTAAPGANGKVVSAAAVVTNATLGVTVNTYLTGTTTASNAGQIGFAVLAANPTVVAVPTTITAVKYYDILVAAPAVATDDTYITLLGTTAAPITASSCVYIYNAAFGRWDGPCTVIALNTFANSIQVKVLASQLTGTPIVLATTNPVIGGIGVPVAVATPNIGATGIDPTNLTFSWPAVAGATGYNFVLADSSANPGTAHFAIIDYSNTTDVNAITVQEVLKYNHTYYWEVQAFNASTTGAFSVLFFTTELEPVATTTATVAPPVTTTVTAPPATSVSVITLPGETTPATIPPYLLWAVIAVGAVLIIVVIVLIVRTRRVG